MIRGRRGGSRGKDKILGVKHRVNNNNNLYWMFFKLVGDRMADGYDKWIMKD